MTEEGRTEKTTVFVSDPSVEAERIMQALRASEFPRRRRAARDARRARRGAAAARRHRRRGRRRRARRGRAHARAARRGGHRRRLHRAPGRGALERGGRARARRERLFPAARERADAHEEDRVARRREASDQHARRGQVGTERAPAVGEPSSRPPSKPPSVRPSRPIRPRARLRCRRDRCAGQTRSASHRRAS